MFEMTKAVHHILQFFVKFVEFVDHAFLLRAPQSSALSGYVDIGISH